MFEGNWKNDNKCGHGTFTFNGEVDQIEYGKIKWPAKSVYIGGWQYDQRYDHGTLTWPNGDVFDGEWQSDSRHGPGVTKSSDGTVLENGEWVRGDYKPAPVVVVSIVFDTTYVFNVTFLYHQGRVGIQQQAGKVEIVWITLWESFDNCCGYCCG